MKKLVLAMALLASCYRTRFELQPPVGYAIPSPLYNEHWHLSVLNIIEVSPPVDLGAACGGAYPAAIDESEGVLAGIVNIFTSYFFPIIHFHNATVLCPAQGGPPPPQY
jgi:hypothetical protein